MGWLNEAATELPGPVSVRFMRPEKEPGGAEASLSSLLFPVFSPQALGTEQRREPGKRAQWRLVAKGCSVWSLVCGGSRPLRGPEGQEEFCVAVGERRDCLTCSSFSWEEALRNRSWVFSKLCLFKTPNPSWALPHLQLPHPGWSQAPQPLEETPML